MIFGRVKEMSDLIRMKDRLRTVVSKVFDYKKMEYSWIEFHRQPIWEQSREKNKGDMFKERKPPYPASE